MQGNATQHRFYQEWQITPTGKKFERSIHIDKLEIHPDYPKNIDVFDDDHIEQIMLYLIKEGAPPHRLYAMPNPDKPNYYYVIGWLRVYKAYKLLGISDLIPTLCYLDPNAHKRLWKNWKNCPGEIIDIK